MATVPLPDPQWSDAAALCPGCGYSLAGLAPPTPCPECGLMHSGRQFVVHGVPSSRSVMSPWRIAAMIALAGFGFTFLQFVGVIVMTLGWFAVLGFLGVWIVGVLAFIMTSKRVSGGKCRFIFVQGGVNVTPIKIDETKGDDPRAGFVRFRGDERVEIKPISTVWARLSVTRPDRTTAFQAGIRCPRGKADHLLTTIDELIRGREASSYRAPPTV